MADSQSAAPKSHQCVGCGVWSPRTSTNYTLISSQYGWRLTREFDAQGNKKMVWRCPTCWAKRKQTTSTSSSSLPPGPGSSGSIPPGPGSSGSLPPGSGTGHTR